MDEEKQFGWLALGAIAVIFCMVGALVGAVAFSTHTTEDIEVPGEYVTFEGVDYTGDMVGVLITEREEAKDAIIESTESLLALNMDYTDLQTKYAGTERENEVLELARLTVEDNYIDELDFDEEEYDDFYFKIMESSYDMDEDGDTGDFDVEINFMIFQYEEDTETLNETYSAIATMEVEDDNDVDDLEIVII